MSVSHTVPSISNYTEALEILNGREHKNICYATALEKDNFAGKNFVAVRHYSTYIIMYYEDGNIKVTTGGYYSRTTFDRISGFLNLRICKSHIGQYCFTYHGREYIYTDGITLYPDGTSDAESLLLADMKYLTDISFTSEEAVKKYFESAPIKVVGKLWRRKTCEVTKEVIMEGIPLDYLPLFLNSVSKCASRYNTPRWVSIYRDRMINAE